MKKTILILVAYYLPGIKAGGPIRSIAGLVEELKDEYNFKIICGDRDLGDETPFPNDPVGLWYDYGVARVLRIPSNLAGAIKMLYALRSESYDILYLNSVWSRLYSIFPTVCRRVGLSPTKPVVLAPRGELSPGALGLKSSRKRLYLALARATGLFNGVIWQASSVAEERDIIELFTYSDTTKTASIAEHLSKRDNSRKPLDVVIAADIGPTKEPAEAFLKCSSKVQGELRVVTLGRVCQMKNIAYAICLFKHFPGQVQYDIYGPLEDKTYLTKCEQQCAELPDGVTVRFMGNIPHDEVKKTLSNYHVFLLPTLGENYGHVIPEAMQAGCVPLISDRTPWRDLKNASAGWDLPLSDPEKFKAALHTALAWSNDEFYNLSRHVARFVRTSAILTNAINENRLLFKAANDTLD